MLILDQFKDQSRFTNVEWTIINYILDSPKDILWMTVDDLAEATFTSPASIIRLCKKLGLKGYKAFKMRLAMELNSFHVTEERIREDIPFSKMDTEMDTVNKILNLNYQALTDTYNDLDVAQLKRVAQMILSYNNLSMYGIGPSFLVAADFYYKMLRIGKNVFLESVPGYPLIRGNYQKENSLALFVSYYAKQPEHLRIAKILHYNNVPMILLTGPRIGPLCRYATERISINIREEETKIGAFSSRTAMQYLMDCIFSMIFCLEYEKNVKLLREKEIFSKLSQHQEHKKNK